MAIRSLDLLDHKNIPVDIPDTTASVRMLQKSTGFECCRRTSHTSLHEVLIDLWAADEASRDSQRHNHRQRPGTKINTIAD